MKKGFVFRALRVVVVLSSALVIAALLVKLRPEEERRVRTEAGMLVEVLPVKAENINMIIEAYGTVKPREALKLVAEVRGQIVHIHPSLKEGAFIKKGTVLIQIDQRTYRLEVERRNVRINQTKAELKRLQQEVHNLEASSKIVKSDVALARAEFFRLKKLSFNNVVAQTNKDKAEQRYLASLEHLQGLENQIALTGPIREQLEAQRDMAVVLFRQAELDLERTSIVAPFDGWVLEKTIEEGQHVNIGQYLGRIYSAGALDVEVRIPVKDLKWFPANSGHEFMPEAKVIFNSGDDFRIWEGRVARIKAQMDEKTRTLPVVVEINGKSVPKKSRGNHYLRPGMFVNVQIKGIEIKRAFVLPRYTVHFGDVVYIALDNRLSIRPVSILRRFKDSIYVEKGLSDGDLLIKTPLSGATEGMLVRVKHRGISGKMVHK